MPVEVDDPLYVEMRKIIGSAPPDEFVKSQVGNLRNVGIETVEQLAQTPEDKLRKIMPAALAGRVFRMMSTWGTPPLPPLVASSSFDSTVSLSSRSFSPSRSISISRSFSPPRSLSPPSRSFSPPPRSMSPSFSACSSSSSVSSSADIHKQPSRLRKMTQHNRSHSDRHRGGGVPAVVRQVRRAIMEDIEYEEMELMEREISQVSVMERLPEDTCSPQIYPGPPPPLVDEEHVRILQAEQQRKEEQLKRAGVCLQTSIDNAQTQLDEVSKEEKMWEDVERARIDAQQQYDVNVKELETLSAHLLQVKYIHSLYVSVFMEAENKVKYYTDEQEKEAFHLSSSTPTEIVRILSLPRLRQHRALTFKGLERMKDLLEQQDQAAFRLTVCQCTKLIASVVSREWVVREFKGDGEILERIQNVAKYLLKVCAATQQLEEFEAKPRIETLISMCVVIFNSWNGHSNSGSCNGSENSSCGSRDSRGSSGSSARHGGNDSSGCSGGDSSSRASSGSVSSDGASMSSGNSIHLPAVLKDWGIACVERALMVPEGLLWRVTNFAQIEQVRKALMGIDFRDPSAKLHFELILWVCSHPWAELLPSFLTQRITTLAEARAVFTDAALVVGFGVSPSHVTLFLSSLANTSSVLPPLSLKEVVDRIKTELSLSSGLLLIPALESACLALSVTGTNPQTKAAACARALGIQTNWT